ncbi:MAG: D-alanyl-D-alanine carboxypeptidase/D-alanyl-D-alanine-endopeptidase [Gammaproteobacteria bacterium]
MGARGLMRLVAMLCGLWLVSPWTLAQNIQLQPAPQPQPEAKLAALPAPVADLVKKYKLALDDVSIFVQDVAADQPLLLLNPDTPRNPASVMKTITTYVALDRLGPTYTWKTEAYVTGPIDAKGTLQGDLVLKGYGDPLLVVESFWKFLRALRDRGLQHITGDLVVDTSYFAPSSADPGAFDGKAEYPYNVIPNALLLNFQSINFKFFPDADQVKIVPEPNPANLTIQNNLKLVRTSCRQSHISMESGSSDTGDVVTFNGTYSANCGGFSIDRVATKPESMVYGVFKSLWQDMGGVIDGGLKLGDPPKKTLFYTFESRTLAEIIRSINKYSNNVMTRHLLLTLGAERFGPPATEQKGAQAVAAWLTENGLSFPELVIDNGAGLSRDGRVAARSLGQLLLKVYRSPYMPEFVASLPITGVDGTLQGRFKGEPLARHGHFKTGTIDNVKAIAGYLLTKTGHTYVAVVLVNHINADKGLGTMVQNELLRWLFEQ